MRIDCKHFGGSFMDAKIRLTLVLLMTVIIPSACESVALMPRPDIDPRTVGRNRAEPTADVDRETRDTARTEVVGTVQRVDNPRREIYLRTKDKNLLVFRYDPYAVVYDRDRDVPVEELRNGDEIAIRPRASSSSERYAGGIRMVDRNPAGAVREY
jgi:hypothetical protein